MIAAGLGFRGAATRASLEDALDQVMAAARLDRVDTLVTESAKSRAPVFRELAQARGLPGLGIRLEDLSEMITETQSQRIQDAYGTGSLCEAAALAAVGPGAELVVARVVSGDGMATAAIARSQGGMT